MAKSSGGSEWTRGLLVDGVICAIVIAAFNLPAEQALQVLNLELVVLQIHMVWTGVVGDY